MMGNPENVAIPIGIKNIKAVKELKSFADEKQFPYSGLWLFSGAQGNGKTLLLMNVLREMVQQYPKALVVSNIAIYGIPSIPYRGIEDFERYNNGADGIIYVIDEIHTLFNSLESEKMPLSTVQVWSQNRKNRRVILGTSQRFNRVAKPIREQTKLLYVCYPPLLWFRRYAVFDATLFDEKGEYQGDPQRKRHYVPSWNVMTMYNTLEVVKRNGSQGYSQAAAPDHVAEVRRWLQEQEKIREEGNYDSDL